VKGNRVLARLPAEEPPQQCQQQQNQLSAVATAPVVAATAAAAAAAAPPTVQVNTHNAPLSVQPQIQATPIKQHQQQPPRIIIAGNVVGLEAAAVTGGAQKVIELN